MQCLALSQPVPLDGDWSICACEPGAAAPEADWVPIQTPLPVAGALREAGQWSLDAPARRFDAQDWWFQCIFDAPDDSHHAYRQRVLGFDGLATLAQVWLNGALLLTSDNAFVRHECDVSALILPAGNRLLMRFASLDRHLQQRRARPRWRAPMVDNQQLRWCRSPLLGRTPGWSPPAALVGPWRDVWMLSEGDLRVRNLQLRTQVNGTSGYVRCDLDLQSLGVPDVAGVELHLSLGDEQHWLSLTAHDQHHGGAMTLPGVTRWWPHTHGVPTLYQASLVFRRNGDTPATTMVIGEVGFRSISVDTTDAGFAIVVNGVRVFCRGACWTPLDVATLRSSAAACEAALVQAQGAGMNMLRVCGTMVVEEDHFYASCDRLGILVWQDLMFANLDYPWDDAAFRTSVTTEVTQQLQWLGHHACLALVCGNSEVAQQAAMWGAARELWSPPMFARDLAELCRTELPQVPYWPSSAWAGAFPHQASAGTTSYYGVGAYLRPLDDARHSGLGFATECLAFANVPPDATLKRMPGGLANRVHHPGWKARSPRDLGAGWDFDDVRDHYLGVLFGLDPTRLRHTDHERYLDLSRITTGEVMAQAFAQWRRAGAHCNGALVLFLRDLWPGAGWGLLDDHGVPKACFYALKRALQPVAVFLIDEGLNGLWVHVVNDSAQALQLDLQLDAWQDGEVRVAHGQQALTLPAHRAHSVSALDFLPHFLDLNHAYQFGPKVCDCVVATLRDPAQHVIGRAFHFVGSVPHTPEPEIGLSARRVFEQPGLIKVAVHSRRLALGVRLELPGFDADDAFFHLPPGTESTVTLRGPNDAGYPSGQVLALNTRQMIRF